MKKSILITIALVASLSLISQVAINNNGNIPNSSAMLDVTSTEKGMLIPRMTLAQRNLITVSVEREGLLIYQTDNTPGYYFYDGSNWVVIGSESISINDLSDGKIRGESIYLGKGTGAWDLGPDDFFNTAIGDSALTICFDGRYNTSTGYMTLFSNQDGNNNTANGYKALYSNVVGDENVAIGSNALYSNGGGYANIATGYKTLYENTTGDNNIAIGCWALKPNITGSNNIGIGYLVGVNNQGGDNNIFIGYQTSGASPIRNMYSNLFIGNGAGNGISGNNKLCIENLGSSSPLVYGEFDNDLLKINGALELQNGTLASSLKFTEPSGSGTNYTMFQSQAQSSNIIYTLPASAGTGGQLLSTDGSGVLSWSFSSAGDIIAVGSMETGEVFANASADNQWLGLGATGGRIEFDNHTIDEVNILDANMGLGVSDPNQKLYVRSDGTGLSYPIKIENKHTVMDEASVGILFSTGGSGTNERGKGGLVYTYTNTWNRGDFQFLQDNESNSGNPDLNDAVVTITNDGNFGIGITNPETPLHVYVGSDATLTGGGFIVTGSVSSTNIAIDNNEIMARDNGAASTLHLNRDGGTVTVGGDNTYGYQLYCDGSAAKPGGGSWTIPSDRNLKNINSSFDRGLNELLQITPVSYNYKSDNALELPSDKEYIGLIAQEVQKVIPEAVEKMESGYFSVNNDPIIWTMLNAIKEQQKTIDELKTEISQMKEEIKNHN